MDVEVKPGAEAVGASGAGTIPEALAIACTRFADSPAIVDSDIRLDYAALDQLVRRACSGLADMGVGPGDRVAIWMSNSWQWVVAAVAAQWCGASIVPINTRLKAAEASYILQRSRASALVTAADVLGVDLLGSLEAATLPDLRQVVTVGHRRRPYRGAATVTDWQGLLDARPWRRRPRARPSDISDIIFTSGTTGFPKGALCSHERTVRCYWEFAKLTGLRPGDRYLVANPFAHSFGYKAGWLAALMTGCTVYPVPVFSVDTVFSLIENERITVFPGPPTMFRSLLDDRRLHTADLASLRVCVTGSTTIPSDLVRQMIEELGFDHVLSAYGITEAGGAGTICRIGDDIDDVCRTVGRPWPGLELRIIDAKGAQVPARIPGEICLRGYNMVGYLDDPAATAEVLDDAGWLRTGDVGTVDERGSVTFHDRIKNVVIVGGFNVYPAEVEACLLTHPAIRMAAVVGVTDRRLGEVVRAFVVARRGYGLNAQQVIDFCRERMANFKAPRSVVFVDDIPTTANGKRRIPEHLITAEVSDETTVL
jgi:acyl-CoA synthetase (AMP-forming)/AMP-acid ligase II